MDDILADTASKGVDLIVEMLANVNLGHDLKVLAHGGCVAIVGSRGEVSGPRLYGLRRVALFCLSGRHPDTLRSNLFRKYCGRCLSTRAI